MENWNMREKRKIVKEKKAGTQATRVINIYGKPMAQPQHEQYGQFYFELYRLV